MGGSCRRIGRSGGERRGSCHRRSFAWAAASADREDAEEQEEENGAKEDVDFGDDEDYFYDKYDIDTCVGSVHAGNLGALFSRPSCEDRDPFSLFAGFTAHNHVRGLTDCGYASVTVTDRQAPGLVSAVVSCSLAWRRRCRARSWRVCRRQLRRTHRPRALQAGTLRAHLGAMSRI